MTNWLYFSPFLDAIFLASGIFFFISSACLSIWRPIMAPAKPPPTAPMMAPGTVLPDSFALVNENQIFHSC